MNTTADRIKLSMEHKSITQEELAKKSMISQPALNKYLVGKTKETRKLHLIAKALDVSLDWLVFGDQKYAPSWAYPINGKPGIPDEINDLAIVQQKGRIPVVRFEHEEITKLINSPNQHTGEFMKTFMDFGEKCFGVILDERHRGLDQPGTVVVFDPDAEPTLDDDCYVLVSFPNIAGRYEIMRHIQYAGDLSLESLSGRAPPVSIRLTGAKIHARAIKRIGDL